MGSPLPQEADLAVHPLSSLDDPLLDDWLDLYQVAFPLGEQLPVSAVLRQVRAPSPRHLLVAVTAGEGREFAGLAWAELRPDDAAVALWYLAVVEGLRGRGVGAQTYRQVLAWAQRQMPGLRALVLEVDRPDLASDQESRHAAIRRIAFYERLGAHLCDVPYACHTGWQPPVPMHLMLHPLRDLTEAEERALLQGVFGLDGA